ncbi:hypothetical protein R1flu_001088 [Riccia fluitans]|uniref:DNA 3'-5' helicase n=1 Tax=Riccia fluitans TaxID=41844 RepID=A0ABD1Y2H6_9MARC
MCGRAGRPQFDDSGTVVIMTKNETKHLYNNLLSGSEPVESELLPCMAQYLNAEIVMMTVSDVGLALNWLKCSFLYIRLRKNPQRYGVQISLPGEQLEKHLKGICLRSIHELAKYGMVEMDEYGFTLRHQEPGRLMAKYYLNIETMKCITKVPERSNIQELLNTLTKAQELSWVQLRRYEKKQLNAINQETSSRVRFHVVDPKGKPKRRIQTSGEKIFVLVNDALSGEPSTLDFTMTQDVSAICTNGARITRCMSDYFIYLKRYLEAQNSLLLTKCLRQRLWEDSAYQLKQLPGIGMVTAKAFLTAGISNFEKLEGADPRLLELIAGRKYPFGDNMKSTLRTLPPKVQLVVRDTSLRIGEKREFLLELTRQESSRAWEAGKWHVADLIAGDESENSLLFHEKISPYVVPVYSKNDISAALISEEFVGMDIFHRPLSHTSLDTSIELMKPSKAQQRKRKIIDSAGPTPRSCSVQEQEPETTSKLQSIQNQQLVKDPFLSFSETSSNELLNTSDFRYRELINSTAARGEPQAYNAGPDQESGSRMTPTETDFVRLSHGTSPRGQDLRSLQSFLDDSNMFSDAGSLTAADPDIRVVGPLPYSHLQPVVREEKQHLHESPPSARSASRLADSQDHNSMEQEVCGAVRYKEDDSRKIPSGTICKPALHSPRGQDLRSLQSFLDDDMCYDDSSLTDLVDFHFQPEKERRNVMTTMPAASPVTGCTDGRDNNSVDPRGHLQIQNMVVEEKVLHGQAGVGNTSHRKAFDGGFEAGSASPEMSANPIRLDGRTINDQQTELDASSMETRQVPSSIEHHNEATGISLPHFNLGLPKSTDRQETGIRNYRAENEASATESCTYNAASDHPFTGIVYSHSVGKSSDQNVVSLGTKSLFSFLYD